jgi:hypothetical protein
MQPDGYTSFLIRLWQTPMESEVQVGWCGELEHVQSGVRLSFGTLCELLEFLRQSTVNPPPEGSPRSNEPP